MDVYTDRSLYEIVADEMERGEIAKGSWLKAMTDALGDETLARSLYVKYRVEELAAELKLRAEEDRRAQPGLFGSLMEVIGRIQQNIEGPNLTGVEGTDKEKLIEIKASSDPTYLANVARSEPVKILRIAAIRNKNLTDQNLLAWITNNDCEPNVQYQAILKLNQRAALKLIVHDNQHGFVRDVAKKRLNEIN